MEKVTVRWRDKEYTAVKRNTETTHKQERQYNPFILHVVHGWVNTVAWQTTLPSHTQPFSARTQCNTPALHVTQCTSVWLSLCILIKYVSFYGIEAQSPYLSTRQLSTLVNEVRWMFVSCLCPLCLNSLKGCGFSNLISENKAWHLSLNQTARKLRPLCLNPRKSMRYLNQC